MSPVVGEFLGTMVLILLGDGVVAGVLLNRSKAQGAGWIVVSAGWGLAVFAGIFVAVAAGSPDAELNPAVTLAGLLRGGLTPTQALAHVGAQMAGAFVGAVLVWIHYGPHWAITDDRAAKLGVFCTAPAVRMPASNAASEAIATFVLVFVILAITGQAGVTKGNPAPGLGPWLVGALVWSIGMSLGGPTGYAINPARDLSPRLAHAVLPIAGKGDSDWGYAWVPVVGPLVGAAAAAGLAGVIGL